MNRIKFNGKLPCPNCMNTRTCVYHIRVVCTYLFGWSLGEADIKCLV